MMNTPVGDGNKLFVELFILFFLIRMMNTPVGDGNLFSCNYWNFLRFIRIMNTSDRGRQYHCICEDCVEIVQIIRN